MDDQQELLLKLEKLKAELRALENQTANASKVTNAGSAGKPPTSAPQVKPPSSSGPSTGISVEGLTPYVVGPFDGEYIVPTTGTKIEVPANYVAKSKIVFGDTLAVYKTESGDVFKNINKVPRKRVEGVLAEKEGAWFFLTDSGVYKVSKVSAEHKLAKTNDMAYAFLPETDATATFAALDLVLNDTPPVAKPQAVQATAVAPSKTVYPNAKVQPKSHTFPQPQKRQIPPVPTKQIPVAQDSPKEVVATIRQLEADDLI